MTKDEFIGLYLHSSGIEPSNRTPNGFQISDSTARVALPCYCGADLCLGWAMIPDDDLGSIDWHKQRDGTPPEEP